jgi:hypothetical protein
MRKRNRYDVLNEKSSKKDTPKIPLSTKKDTVIIGLIRQKMQRIKNNGEYLRDSFWSKNICLSI